MKNPKYYIGDKVHCFRKDDFDFIGIVEKVNIVDDNEIEYKVTNAPSLFPELYFNSFPLLIWEQEMELQK